MMQQAIDTLIKYGGPWAVLLIIVSVYFVNEQKKIKEEHKAQLELKNAEHKTRTDRLDEEHKAQLELKNAEVNKAVAERNSVLSQMNQLQVAHAAIVQELNSAIHTMQAEQYQHRLRDQELFRNALLQREQEVIGALTESAAASEEQSQALDRLQELMTRMAQLLEQLQAKGRKSP